MPAATLTATLRLAGRDRKGILNEITTIVSGERASDIRGLNVKTGSQDFHCDMTVRIDTLEALEKICRSLGGIEGITEVNCPLNQDK